SAGFGDHFVPGQGRLDLGGGDVLASTNDQLFKPARQGQVAPLVHHTEISSVHEPVTIHRRRGRRGVVEIADHLLIATRTDLSRVTYRHDRAGDRVYDFAIDLRERPAYGGEQVVTVIVGPGRGEHGRKFGLAEHVHHCSPEGALGGLDEL